MKQKLRNSFIFMFIGFASGLLFVEFQIQYLSIEFIDEVIGRFGRIEYLHIIGALQLAVLSFVFSFIGQILLDKTGLKLHTKWRFSKIVLAIIFGFIAALSMYIIDYYVFADAMKAVYETQEHSLLKVFSDILYGGIVEEVLIRQFFLSGILYLLVRYSKEDSKNLTLFAVIFTSVIIVLVRMPEMSLVTTLTTTIVFRTILFNMIPSLIYGYVFTKHGLTYSILSHISAYIVLYFGIEFLL